MCMLSSIAWQPRGSSGVSVDRVGLNFLSYLPHCVGSALTLPVNPSLSSDTITLPPLDSDDSWSGTGCPGKQAAVVITEGLPPVSTKILEKIQNREFVELATLLSLETPSRNESLSIIQDGQSMIVRPQSEPAGRKRITDLSTWLQAFSIYAATLAASDKTTTGMANCTLPLFYM